MKLSAFLLLLVLTACSASVSQNATRTVSWTNPTTNTDGTPFTAATEQSGTLISWGTKASGPYPNQSTAPGAATSIQVSVPNTAGSYYFIAVTQAKNGTQSGPSTEVTFRVPFPPSPPTDLQVN